MPAAAHVHTGPVSDLDPFEDGFLTDPFALAAETIRRESPVIGFGPILTSSTCAARPPAGPARPGRS
jgi:hypothetical protein